MNRLRCIWQVAAVLAVGAGLAACRPDLVRMDEQQSSTESAAADPQGDQGLVIENDSALPDGFPNRYYELRFRARGGNSPLHWRVEKGALPPWIQLDDNGLLRGTPMTGGEFQFTVSVMEGGRRESAVEKGFTLRVLAALALNWKDPARVNGNRIEGSATVTNATPDDMDLTFIVLAVAPNGRATAIGYQHFLLRGGTVEKELPFGETLPRGGYVVHVDAVGEVVPKKLIYRERLRTGGALQVNVGP